MKKIMIMLCSILILYVPAVFAAELPDHPNFTVTGQVKYNPRDGNVMTFWENGKQGITDTNETVIVKPEWDMVDWCRTEEAQALSFGVCRNGLWGLLDQQGNVLYPPQWKEILIQREEIRVLDANDRYGYLTADGKPMIEFKYDYAESNFHNGIALIGRDFGYTYIDRQGNEILPLQPHRMSSDRFDEYFYYNTNDEKTGILERNGNLVVKEGTYEYISMYHKDCIVAKQNGKWGAVRLDGSILIPFEYDRIDYFYNTDPKSGIFNAIRGEKEVYFREDGSMIGASEWDVSSYGAGGELIYIEKADRYGLMRKDGSLVSDPVFSSINSTSASDHFFGIQKDGLTGILKSDGTYLVQPKWAVDAGAFHELENGYFTVRNYDTPEETKYGLLDPEGRLIIEPMFEDLFWKGGQWFALTNETWYCLKLMDNPQIRDDTVLTEKMKFPEVDYMVEQGFLKGDENGDLRLWDNITRAEFVTLLGNIQNWDTEGGTVPFEDVQNHWARGAIAAAVQKGVMKGVEETVFQPDAYITYTQTFTILLRAMGFTEEEIGNPIHTLEHDAKLLPRYMSMISSEAATREDIARILYCYLHTDMTAEKVRALPPKTVEYVNL